MTQLPTRGMQTTIDHAAAASEAPVMISPRMIHTTTFPTLTPSTVFLCRLGFTTAFYQHAHHHLRTFAQLAPQTNTVSFTSHHEKQRASVDILILNMFFRIYTDNFSGFFAAFLCFPRFSGFSSFDPSVSDSMTVLTPPLLPHLTFLHLFSLVQLAQIHNRCSTPTIQ